MQHVCGVRFHFMSWRRRVLRPFPEPPRGPTLRMGHADCGAPGVSLVRPHEGQEPCAGLLPGLAVAHGPLPTAAFPGERPAAVARRFATPARAWQRHPVAHSFPQEGLGRDGCANVEVQNTRWAMAQVNRPGGNGRPVEAVHRRPLRSADRHPNHDHAVSQHLPTHPAPPVDRNRIARPPARPPARHRDGRSLHGVGPRRCGATGAWLQTTSAAPLTRTAVPDKTIV